MGGGAVGCCLLSRGNWGDISHGFGNTDMYEFCDQGMWVGPRLCVCVCVYVWAVRRDGGGVVGRG